VSTEQTLRLIWDILGVIGALTTLLLTVGGVLTFIEWNLGIWPLMKRLGLGRWYRKVLIVGAANETKSLKKDLVDSGVFRADNIDEASESNLSDVEDASLVLLDYWSLNTEQVKKVISNKRKSAGLIVYSPMSKPRIPDEISETINNEPFTTLVNMRGRLVNDLLVTLMSTSYDKKHR